MNPLFLADIDDLHWRHGSGHADVLLSCGDIADKVILEAAEAYSCSAVFAVKGNHDTKLPFPDPIVDLHLHVETFSGLKFGGFNGSWKYKPRGHFLYEQEEAEKLLSNFPPVDVFISHNSPWGIHDQPDEVHHGFDALNSYIERAKPRLLIHGHQHVNRETVVGETRVIGVFGVVNAGLSDPSARIAPMTSQLGSATFQNKCIYRARPYPEERQKLGKHVEWVCSIQPGKECSASVCNLETYPFGNPKKGA